MEYKQVHLFISGNVQGVGFRYFVLQFAKELGINGWVRNLSDGRVEVVAVGKDRHVDSFIQECRKGPIDAVVEHIDISYENVEKMLHDFVIR